MITRTVSKTPDLFPLHDIRIVDGDTIVATIPLPFKTSVRKTIRLKGWWAAELNTIFHSEAVRAAQRLHDFCCGKALWLLTAGCRLDKYGRVIGHLQHDGRIISPREVLGDLSLTAAEHKLRHDRQARSGKAPTTPFSPSDGSRVAESPQNASTGPLGPTSAWVPTWRPGEDIDVLGQ